MTDVRNAESAILSGQAKSKAWMGNFMRGWMEPYADDFVKMWWASLPPEMKAEMKQIDPKKYAEVESRLGAIGGNRATT